ncbi:MAG: phytanoyl-CoA dioxygenase family protein [Acidobacteriaceae bacterium]|nr:phytanoyl-CoA dioxygenase family protein [Acidobacteriaceae bacterium]
MNDLLAIIETQAHAKRGRGGVRDVLDNVPALRNVADHPAVRDVVEGVLGEDAFLVRSILFDKTDTANWKVPWHQDVTIAVRERRDTENFGPWSSKQGVTHVQPPTAVLESMVTVRIHLDPCPKENGALRVMPGTHKLGRIDQNEAPLHIEDPGIVTCTAALGEALVMRPLLLHASSASENPKHRRVLHFDFANIRLPNSLSWHLQ